MIGLFETAGSYLLRTGGLVKYIRLVYFFLLGNSKELRQGILRLTEQFCKLFLCIHGADQE